MNKFRPQEFNGRFVIRERRRGHSVAQYNWQSHIRYYRDSDLYRKHQIRVSSQLHYLGSHSPAPVRKRWWPIERQYLFKRTPIKASNRYMNRKSEISGSYWL